MAARARSDRSAEVHAFIESIEDNPHACGLWNWAGDFVDSELDTYYLVKNIMDYEAKSYAAGMRHGRAEMRRRASEEACIRLDEGDPTELVVMAIMSLNLEDLP